LSAADVAEILRLVEESSFDELSLEFEGLKLNFKRRAAGEDRSAPTPDAPAHTGPSPPPAMPHEATQAGTPADANSQAVLAPLLGTFYHASKPGAPPFVSVGSAVEPDTIVGIIEVMKLMNTVRAGVHGTVTDVVARDGALVEYGEVLLRVGRTP
jgi:acetyl-CoA carboxylase biotin carboxyl carrier protein